MNRGCVITPSEPRKHDQKYKPFLRKNVSHSLMLSSTQMYQAMPMKAAMVIATGRSFFRSSATPMVANLNGSDSWRQRTHHFNEERKNNGVEKDRVEYSYHPRQGSQLGK